MLSFKQSLPCLHTSAEHRNNSILETITRQTLPVLLLPHPINAIFASTPNSLSINIKLLIGSIILIMLIKFLLNFATSNCRYFILRAYISIFLYTSRGAYILLTLFCCLVPFWSIFAFVTLPSLFSLPFFFAHKCYYSLKCCCSLKFNTIFAVRPAVRRGEAV